LQTLRDRGIMLHELFSAGAALINIAALLLLFPQAAAHLPDAGRLVSRAVANWTNLAAVQVATCLGAAALLSLLSRWPAVDRRLAVHGPRQIFTTLLRAALPLTLLLTVHQSVPLWQHMTGWADKDLLLIRLDETLFFGTNPVLWLQHLIRPWVTEYMWTVYLTWFLAFQGTIYLLAALRPREQWQDMVLGTMVTLALGYVGYVLVPAVGPVHAMKAQFTMDLQGGPMSAITNGVVDRYGVWRDAFPSLHSAVSMLLMLYAWRYLKQARWLYTVLCVSILISTVYLRWHYVVDVIAGCALSAFGAWAAPRLVTWYAGRTAVGTAGRSAEAANL
jgi:membrane-associated phospholipid phosphatase